MDNVNLDFFRRKILEGICQSFYRSVHITLEDNIQFFEIAKRDSSSNFIECNMALSTYRLLALKLRTFRGYCFGFTLIVKNIELISGLWRPVQSEYGNGS